MSEKGSLVVWQRVEIANCLQSRPLIAGQPLPTTRVDLSLPDPVPQRLITHPKLASDPRLPAPGEIAVEAFGDAVTLRGTVGSFAQQRAAVKDARRTPGVVDVYVGTGPAR